MRSPIHINFLDSFIASILVLQVPLLILELSVFPPWFTDFIYSNNAAIPNFLFTWFWLIGLLFASIYTFYSEKKETIDTSAVFAKRHTFFIATIRYVLAFIIAVYAFAKILAVQFQSELYQKDTKVVELSGLRLTWYYFGYSSKLRLILGYTELLGSLFLLFRRTTLLGVFILLPVMINVLLVNMFFDIGIRPLINSLLLTFGLIYILSLNWRKIAQVLFLTPDPSPVAKSKLVKNILRIGFISLAFFIEYGYHRSSYLHNPIQGKWNVKQMIDGSSFDRKKVEGWSNLYFEHDGMCAVSTNPYYYSNKSGMEGDYFYDAATNHLKANFYNSAGQVQTLTASINYISIDSVHMNGIYLEDTVRMVLIRDLNSTTQNKH